VRRGSVYLGFFSKTVFGVLLGELSSRSSAKSSFSFTFNSGEYVPSERKTDKRSKPAKFLSPVSAAVEPLGLSQSVTLASPYLI
jgi:hypothetical protein